MLATPLLRETARMETTLNLIADSRVCSPPSSPPFIPSASFPCSSTASSDVQRRTDKINMPSMFFRHDHREMCIILKRVCRRVGEGRVHVAWMKDRRNLWGRRWVKRFLPIIDGESFDLCYTFTARRVCWFLKLLFLFEKACKSKFCLLSTRCLLLLLLLHRTTDSRQIFCPKVFIFHVNVATSKYKSSETSFFLHSAFYVLFERVSRDIMREKKVKMILSDKNQSYFRHSSKVSCVALTG